MMGKHELLSNFRLSARLAMDRLQALGENNVDRMRELLGSALDDATVEWQTDHVEATTDEEEE